MSENGVKQLQQYFLKVIAIIRLRFVAVCGLEYMLSPSIMIYSCLHPREEKIKFTTVHCPEDASSSLETTLIFQGTIHAASGSVQVVNFIFSCRS